MIDKLRQNLEQQADISEIEKLVQELEEAVNSLEMVNPAGAGQNADEEVFDAEFDEN